MEEKIKSLWEETRELSLGRTNQIPRLQTPPTPLHFLRHFLSQNKPFILSSSSSSSSTPSSSHLLHSLSSCIPVHLSPSGLADSLTPLSPSSSSSTLCFASASVKTLPFPDALASIRNSTPHSNFIAYAQDQNNCFHSGAYDAIRNHFPDHVDWATEAVGSLPDAVNIWIGNECSVTSFHKDHYENLYLVVTGEKHFLLLPPTDVHRMYVRHYPAARYHYDEDTEEFKLELEDPIRYVPWCSVNPYPSPESKEKEMAEFPLYFNGPKPFECTVKAGEMLYLPSMWFHHVRQTPDKNGLCIAINYWYDMQFDIKYAYFNFLQSINYPALHDVTHHGKKCMKCSDPSACNMPDGLDSAADEADGCDR